MALDTALVNRLVAASQGLAEQSKAAAVREAAKDQEIARLSAALGQAESDIAADAKADTEANETLARSAEAVEALTKGPETPAVETPLPADTPAVAEGSQEPVVVSEEPAPTPEQSA